MQRDFLALRSLAVVSSLARIILFVALSWFASAASAITLYGSGSDTMRELMLRWANAIAADSGGELVLDYQSVGSAFAPGQLVDERVDIIAMSREMTADEREAFRRARFFEPVRFAVALDALAIYVHKDNPLRGITMQQLDAMFSTTRRCGRGWFSDSDPIVEWSELSFTRLGRIALYGRSTDSGTYDYFRDAALCGGEFRPEVLEMRDSKAIIEAVAANPNGIGYAGIGYLDGRVRVLALSPTSTFFEAPYYHHVVERYADSDDLEKRYGWVLRNKYPLSRKLYMYAPTGDDNRISVDARRFVDFALSPRGQEIVHEAGYIPLPTDLARVQRQNLAEQD